MDSLESMNAIGAIHFWGYSPGVNFFQTYKSEDYTTKKEVNVLLSGTSDIRHILRTFAAHPGIKKKSGQNLNIYINEKDKEVLARILLQLTIANEVGLTKFERMDLLLDIAGNTLIRERSQNYIDFLIPELSRLITQDKKCATLMKNVVDFSLLKFKQRDELESLIRTWSSKTPFDIEKFRDNRLRNLFKENYDFRGNRADWDYHQGLIDEAPIIQVQNYRRFRVHGQYYETKFSSYTVPNRTLASYTEGRKWGSRDSCLVRGYWGDIMISPFIAYGVEVDSSPEKEKLFKHYMGEYFFDTILVMEFNVLYYLFRLENLEDYHYQFEDSPGPEEKKKEDVKMKSETEEKESKSISRSIPEESKVKTEEPPMKEEKFHCSAAILPAFENLGVKIYLMSEDIPQLFVKPRFSNLFDVAVIGFYHGHHIKEGFNSILKESAVVYAEVPKFFVGVEKALKEKTTKKIVELAKLSKLQQVDSPYLHHLLFTTSPGSPSKME